MRLVPVGGRHIAYADCSHEDLAALHAALNDPAIATLAEAYPATLPAGAGDTLTIYGALRRTVRFDSRELDLPLLLQQLVGEVMRQRGRF
jgi:hypothetical protein